VADKVFKAQFPYVASFVRPRRRTTEYGWFAETQDLIIEQVEESAAPVAFEIGILDVGDLFAHYRIRSFRGRLWWQLGGDCDLVLRPEIFEGRLQEADFDALVALDASFAECTDERPLDPLPKEFTAVAEIIPQSHGDCLAAVQRGASKAIYCGEAVFVEAGEPIFYAVPSDDDPKHLVLKVGSSDMTRESTERSRSLPGPYKSHRKSCARRGLAFGPSELEDGLCALEQRGYRILRASKIEAMLEEPNAETAPQICAQELAEFLFTESTRDDERGDRLRLKLPVLSSIADTREARDRCIEILNEINSSIDPVVAFSLLVEERRSASSILRRIDDAALRSLGMS